jgi:copper chaperone NosL
MPPEGLRRLLKDTPATCVEPFGDPSTHLFSGRRKEMRMHRLNRRQFITSVTWLAAAKWISPLTVAADPNCTVDHPLAPPDPSLYGRCPNCGMMRSMWARTWKTFRLVEGPREACSFHCLAEMAFKADQTPQDVQTALFLQPRGMIPAEAGWYVVGSSARGTMTSVSKTAFASRSTAAAFARSCGGDVMDYPATYRMAAARLTAENAMIDKKRLAAGKIAIPADLQDECIVCHMYPSRYPRHRSQVALPNGRIDHFCSTHCLFIWLGDSGNDIAAHDAQGMIWVSDFVSGRWISGRTAYYVVDSDWVGPMGAEAVAFDRVVQAREFARGHAGRVLPFEQVKTGSSAWGPSS